MWVFLLFPSDSGALMSSDQNLLLYSPFPMQGILLLSLVNGIFFRKATSPFLTLQILLYYQGIILKPEDCILFCICPPLIFLSTVDKRASFTQQYYRIKDSKTNMFPMCFPVNQCLLLKSYICDGCILLYYILS